MLVVGFPAAAFATNCYVLAPAPGQECLVVDPGLGVLDQLGETLATHRLRPAAVLLTHGHIDHVASVTPVCAGGGVAAHLHGADRYRLADPFATLDPALRHMLAEQFEPVRSWTEPSDVVELTDGATLQLAGLSVRVVHAPGHTEGSVLFCLPGEGGEPPTCLTGDVLFAGAIGRTDLPGGDAQAMRHSLATRVLPMPDETRVLPGHGPSTTMARERASNPFLLELAGAPPA